jgi:tetratricopeptide (TPR) repeat protein
MKSLRLLSLGALAVLQAAPAYAYAPAPSPFQPNRHQDRVDICMGEADTPRAERRAACNDSLQVEVNRAVRADLLASRGWLSQGEQAFSTALRDFDAALKAVPDHFAAMRGRASVLSETGRHDEAQALIERAIAAGGAPPSLLIDRAVLRERAGDVAGARADLDRIVLLDPSNGWARAARARLLQGFGEHEAALADIEAVIEIEPAIASHHYRRAMSLAALERPGEAVPAFDAALRLEPAVPQAWFERGRAFEALGHPRIALRSYERALNFDRHHEAALSRRAFLLQRAGETEQAIAAYGALLATYPQTSFALNNRAGLLIGLGRAEEALRDLDAAIALVPGDGNALRNRAHLHLTLGRMDRALEDLDRAGPGRDRAAWHGMRGDVLLALDKAQPALEAYRAALALRQQDRATLFGMGLAQELRGDRYAAVAAYDAVLALDPGHAGATERREALLPALGRSIEVWPARLAGLWRDAVETISARSETVLAAVRPVPAEPVATAAAKPQNPLAELDAALALDGFDVPRLIRRAQFGIGHPQRQAQARADLATALLIEPGNPAALVQRARLHHREGAYAAAQLDAEAALRAQPRSVEALFQRARALEARGQGTAALKAYDEVVAAAPENAAALLNRGLLLQRARHYQRALSDFDAAVAADRGDADGWLARASLRAMLGDNESAAADYREALVLAPHRLDVALGLTQALIGAQQPLLAIDELGRLIKRHPEQAGLWNMRCLVRAVSGEPAGALPDCEEALRLAPNHGAVLHTRGLVQLKRGDLEGAIADFDKALSLDARFGQAWYGRALAHQRRGDSAEAAADFARARDLDAGAAERYRAYGLTP